MGILYFCDVLANCLNDLLFYEKKASYILPRYLTKELNSNVLRSRETLLFVACNLLHIFITNRQ